MLGTALTANAQYLPNGTFESWKTTSGASYATSDSKDYTRPGVEPTSWNSGNVNQFNTVKNSNLCTKATEGTNNYTVLTNKKVEMMNVGSLAPAFLSLNKPWIFAKSTMLTPALQALGDGGTYGSTAFSNKPDALRVKYRRTATNGEVAHVIAYLWDGTFTSEVPSNYGKTGGGAFNPTYGITSYTTLEDVDRAILDKPNARTLTKGTLVASCDYEIKANVASWTEVVIPMVYKTTTVTPSKMNVIISSADYWTRSNLQLDSKLEVDDVQFVYYSDLTSLTINGKAITLVNGQTEYTVDEVVVDGDVTATAHSQFANVKYTYYNDKVEVLVTANDGSTTTYTINTKAAKADPVAADVAGDYQSLIMVNFGGENYSVNDIQLTANADNTVNFILNDFSFPGVGRVGNVKVTNVPLTWDGDNVALKCEQDITIEGADPALNLVDMPLVLNAIVSTDKALTATLTINWNNGTIIPIKINKLPFTYAKDGGAYTFGDATIDDAMLMVIYSIVSGNGGATSIDMSTSTISLSEVTLGDMAAVMPNVLFYAGTNAVSGMNTVSNGVCEKLALTDGILFVAPKPFTASAVTYDRAFKTGDYISSFVLPFSAGGIQGKVYEFKSVNGTTLNFEDVTTIEANKPYLIQANAAAPFAAVTSAAVAVTPETIETVRGNVAHVGSYAAQTVTSDATTAYYGYQDGAFVKANNGTLNPFRTLIKATGTQATTFALSLNGETSGIISTTTELGRVDVYNVEGKLVRRQVEAATALQGLEKGIYVVGGHKVVK